MRPEPKHHAFGWRILVAALVATGTWLSAQAAPAGAAPARGSGAEPVTQPADAGTEATAQGEPVPAPEATAPAETAHAVDSQSRREQALALLTEGNELMATRDFGAALRRYQAAYALYPSEKLLLNMGTSLLQLGRLTEAAETYERYVRDPRAEPRRIEELRPILADIDKHTGWLTIDAPGPGATASVDGKPLAGLVTRSTVRVDPGEHRVVIAPAGSEPMVAVVALAPGERRTVRLPAESTSGTREAHRTAAGALGAVGAAGLALGAVFGTLAIVSVVQQRAEHSPTLDEATSQYADFAYGGLAAGAALVGTALVVALTAPDDETELEVSASPCSEVPWGLTVRLRW